MFIAPGSVIYVSLHDAATLELPPPERHIAYYLPDHLNSSNVIVDGAGKVIKEECYFPFGGSRYRYDAAEAAALLPAVYGYNQHEHDEETALDFFWGALPGGGPLPLFDGRSLESGEGGGV